MPDLVRCYEKDAIVPLLWQSRRETPAGVLLAVRIDKHQRHSPKLAVVCNFDNCWGKEIVLSGKGLIKGFSGDAVLRWGHSLQAE